MQQAAHRPVPAVDRQHGRRLDALGARAVRLRLRARSIPTISSRRWRTRSTSLILADDARVPIAGAAAAAAAAAAGGGGRAVRPEYAVSADAGRPAARSSSSSAAAAPLVCLSNASDVRHPAVQAAGEERRRRPAAGGVLPARLDRRSDDRSDASGDGRHAGEGGGVRRRQSRCSRRRTASRDACSRSTRTPDRRCCPAI